jgi:hypothetical protein
MTPPTASPCDSPKVVSLKILPKVFPIALLL